MKLKCPVCGKPLEQTGKSLVCENRHTFDFAKSGYINLLNANTASHGDNKEMTKARTAFLATDSYRFLRDAISKCLEEKQDGIVLDLGCGEGYYTSVLPGSELYGFDISKDMTNVAAKHDKNTTYVVASIFDLPVFDSCADAVLTCFAPCKEEEIIRVLKQDGIFVFVSPGPKHLHELKEVLYEQIYDNENEQRFTSLKMIDEQLISQPFAIEHENIMNLFQMTPYYYHTAEEGKAKLAEIASMSFTAEFLIRIYKKQDLR